MNTAGLAFFQTIRTPSTAQSVTSEPTIDFEAIMEGTLPTNEALLEDTSFRTDINELLESLAETGLFSWFPSDRPTESDLSEMYQYMLEISEEGTLVELNEDQLGQLQNLVTLLSKETNIEVELQQFFEQLQPTPPLVLEEVTNELQDEKLLEANMMQLMTQIQAVFEDLQQGQRIEELASKLIPILKEWSVIQKQVPEQTLEDRVTKHVSKEALEILNRLHELYEKRTHFQSKQIYGQNASVTRTDVAQWLTAAIDQLPEQTDRVIPIFNHDQMLATKMPVLQQQAIYNSNMESVQRIEAEMTQRIATMIQQNIPLQSRGALQTLSVTLTPDYLGTLNINFTKVNGEMIVRIMTSSSMTKEILESNLHQLKQTFAPHQVQVIRDDTVIDEEVLHQQEEEQLADDGNEDNEEQLTEQPQEEHVSLDFSALFNQILETEGKVDDEG